MVSYSGAAIVGIDLEGAPAALTTFLQRTGQAQQPSIPMPILSMTNSRPLISGNSPSRKLRIGMLPETMPPSRALPPVPASCKPFARVPSRTSWAARRAISRIVSWSAPSRFSVPNETTALRFFVDLQVTVQPGRSNW